MVDFLFLEDAPIDEKAFDTAIRGNDRARDVLAASIKSFQDVSFGPDVLHASLVEIGEELGLNLRKAQAPVRVAVTGRSVGPPLFESMALLGREEVIRRLANAVEKLD